MLTLWQESSSTAEMYKNSKLLTSIDRDTSCTLSSFGASDRAAIPLSIANTVFHWRSLLGSQREGFLHLDKKLVWDSI